MCRPGPLVVVRGRRSGSWRRDPRPAPAGPPRWRRLGAVIPGWGSTGRRSPATPVPFYVTAGQVTFGVDGDDDLLAPPGTLVHIPGGSTNWFRFGPGGGEMISMTSRAGAAAFFADVDREISPTEPDFGVLLGVASSHGLTVPLSAS